jgi:preprotein translocase subunit SecE
MTEEKREVSSVSDAKAVRGGRKSGKPGDTPRTGPVTFLRQVVAELRKVVYPTQEQLVTYFFVVMIFVMVMIAIVTLLDLGFGKLVFAMFGGAGDS